MNKIIKLTVLYSAILFCSTSLGAKTLSPTFLPHNDPNHSQKHWVAVPEMTDEFDGTQIDASKWTKNPTDRGWGWVGRPPALFTPESVQVKDGNLTITVGKLPDAPRTVRTYNKNLDYTYHGGIIHSVVEGQVGYYVECKLKMSKTEMGGGFWMTTHRPANGISQEIDVVECLGKLSPKSFKWSQHWEHSMNSNTHHNSYDMNSKKRIHKNWAKNIVFPEKNSDRFFVYGVWRKSPTELMFFLDGKHVYTINPELPMDMPCCVNISIEAYDWNPIPDDGGAVVSGKPEDKVAYVDWVRVWKLAEK